MKKYRNATKPYSRPSKQYQKNLVVIDYQGNNQTEEIMALAEYHKIYDGCIRYNSEMTESEIRDEIVRLLGQKDSMTHDLSNVLPPDFDFVLCSNHKVWCIDGNVPFDANGITQVYKDGSV